MLFILNDVELKYAIALVEVDMLETRNAFLASAAYLLAAKLVERKWTEPSKVDSKVAVDVARMDKYFFFSSTSKKWNSVPLSAIKGQLVFFLTTIGVMSILTF